MGRGLGAKVGRADFALLLPRAPLPACSCAPARPCPPTLAQAAATTNPPSDDESSGGKGGRLLLQVSLTEGKLVGTVEVCERSGLPLRFYLPLCGDVEVYSFGRWRQWGSHDLSFPGKSGATATDWAACLVVVVTG